MPLARVGFLSHPLLKGSRSTPLEHLPKSNRLIPLDYDKNLYKFREKVERFFNNLKQFRCIATRYEKLIQTFLALIHLVAAWIIIK
jgi:transposase